MPKRVSTGWKALGVLTVQSGFPFSVVGQYGTVQYGYDSFDGIGARPFLLQTPTYAPSGGPQVFSNAVVANNGVNGVYFSTPLTNTSNGAEQIAPGNLGRNTFVGRAWWNMDFSLVKDTADRQPAALHVFSIV
jgi:hypothetical protein